MVSWAPVPGYRGKLVALAGAAAAVPFALLSTRIGAGSLALALVGSGLALVALAEMLHPIVVAARALRDAGDVDDAAPPSPERTDEAGQLIADAQRLSARLETLRHRLAHRHPVTGLPTREPLLARLTEETARGDAAGVLGVIRFGNYDELAAFDQVRADRTLAAFAKRLEGAIQPGRALAQVNGDSFAVWIADAAGQQAAAREFQALVYVLSQDLGDGDTKIGPDVGIGAAVFPADAADPPTLLTRAFAAVPKQGQRVDSRLVFYSPQASDAARQRFAMEQGLRQAIARDQFLLHYQPVFDLAQGRAVGAEALLRWRHPELGLVSPDRFVPILEQSGLMEEVGLWVLNAACRQARAWEDQGLADLKMSVNLSARQCHDPAFATVILRVVERHGLRPEALELELTETAAMEDADRTRALLGELRSMGMGVALDDFGAGYSSLSYLKNLPFSKLKIDREFVTSVDRQRNSRAICAALIELARGLEITVLAEGVETREEVETLRELGCTVFQGFYFARPMPAAEFGPAISDPAWRRALASPAGRRIKDLARRIGA
ncbi:MAG TPA: bifunctional diguanylate cyclase/phosphodiesterase [Caulobacteraceae bacterium]|nr:bifunctional diguanylate cyclase/phosphodiesterase [Caulobacteraceae bacterium]